MGKIIAIGGGKHGQPKEEGGFHPKETNSIDQEIINQTGKKNPNLLFIPTASSDDKGYIKSLGGHFTELGCNVNVLTLTNKKYTKKELEDSILKTDAIYVGGGNTLNMMNLWRRLGVDEILKKAYKENIVLSGLSAGSICWFKYGNSDSRRYTSGSDQLIKVTSLGLVEALNCPHYDTEKLRAPDLKRMMKTTPKIVSIAVDNSAAIEIIDDQYRIIRDKETANAYKVYWKQGNFHRELIPVKETFSDLAPLLKK